MNIAIQQIIQVFTQVDPCLPCDKIIVHCCTVTQVGVVFSSPSNINSAKPVNSVSYVTTLRAVLDSCLMSLSWANVLIYGHDTLENT